MNKKKTPPKPPSNPQRVPHGEKLRKSKTPLRNLEGNVAKLVERGRQMGF